MQVVSAADQAMLSVLYTQPHRKYHNINHINDCLTELEHYVTETNPDGETKEILTNAIWWHDAVYNPYSKLNEQNSAALYLWHTGDHKHTGNVENFLEYLESQRGTSVRKYYTAQTILRTAKHTVTQTSIVTPSHTHMLLPVSEVMLDIDLAGFGKPMHVYASNSLNIRDEYYNTTDMDFMNGRMAFLTAISKRECLYYTEWFKNKYHNISRDNLDKDMEVLDDALRRHDTAWYFEWLRHEVA